MIDKKEAEQFKLKVRLEAQNKEKYLNLYLNNLSNSLKAVAYNPYFLSYVVDKRYIDSAEFLFLTIMLEHQDYMQLRYLDKKGIENLRYDRKEVAKAPYKIEKLQDKSNRYYFKEASRLKDGEIYTSKIDYNIENGKVQYPIVPVFRVSTPIYIKGDFKGVLTINTFAKKIIEIFSSSPIFDTIIFDRDGYLIYAYGKYYDREHHPKTIDKLLSLKGLQLPLKKEQEYLVEEKKIYIKALKMGNQILDVAFIIKPNATLSFQKSDYKLVAIVMFALFILAFPLSFTLSRPTEYMYKKLEEKRKRLREQADTLERKIEEKTIENAKKDRLIIHQARLAELGEMIGNIAHQWRHPLTRLSLIIQNINAFSKKDKLTKEKLNEMTKVANEQIFFMSDTIDNFKDFYKPVSESRDFTLQEAFDKVMHIIGYDLKHKNINIEFQDECNIKLYGDINQFSQVLINLIANARDALIERKIAKPEITISTTCSKESYTIEISDNAGGIPKENLKTIFEPYFSTKQHGTGIGLYMVVNIIESKFNGNVEVFNNSKGAVFRISL